MRAGRWPSAARRWPSRSCPARPTRRRPARHGVHHRPRREAGRARAADGRGHRAGRAPEPCSSTTPRTRRATASRRSTRRRSTPTTPSTCARRCCSACCWRAPGARGRIVNLISGQFLGPMPGELAYTASKGALEAFTRQLAAEVAHLGITVNAVGPGPNDTGWIDDDAARRAAPALPDGPAGRARRTPRRWWPGCARTRPAGSRARSSTPRAASCARHR